MSFHARCSLCRRDSDNCLYVRTKPPDSDKGTAQIICKPCLGKAADILLASARKSSCFRCMSVARDMMNALNGRATPGYIMTSLEDHSEDCQLRKLSELKLK